MLAVSSVLQPYVKKKSGNTYSNSEKLRLGDALIRTNLQRLLLMITARA